MTRIRGTAVEIEYCGPGAYANDYDDGEHLADGNAGGDMQGLVAKTSSPPSVSMEDWEIGEVLIREFWERLGITGGREAIRVPDVGKEIREAAGEGTQGSNKGKLEMGRKHRAEGLAGVDLARQYMEVFRFNR